MHVTACEFKAGTLTLKTTSPDALKFAMTFKEGDYEIGKEKKLRSLDANAFAWSLIGQLSAAMSIDKDVIYRNAVCAVGAFETMLIRNDAFDAFARVWAQKGLSWIAEKVDEQGDYAVVNAYYGSSVYDTKQMSALIDYLVQDCESIGIETDGGRIASLLEEWDAKHGS